MRLNVSTAQGPGQSARRRQQNPRDDRQRRAAEVFGDLLAARRHTRLNEVRHLAAELLTLGFRTEPAGEELRMVAIPGDSAGADVLPFQAAARSPVLWFARLVRSLAESDPDLESRSLAELEALGFGVAVARENRRGVAR